MIDSVSSAKPLRQERRVEPSERTSRDRALESQEPRPEVVFVNYSTDPDGKQLNKVDYYA